MSTIVCRRLSFGYDGSERRSPLKRERRHLRIPKSRTLGNSDDTHAWYAGYLPVPAAGRNMNEKENGSCK